MLKVLQNSWNCFSGCLTRICRGERRGQPVPPMRGGERRRLKKRIWSALRDCEIEMFLQFIVNCEDGRICGGEALSRWKHPQHGLLCPNCYIALMESEGAIAELDFYMFDEVCRQLERWHGDGEELVLSCNFARMTIGRDDFVGRIAEIAGRYSFDHGNLVIEITEDAVEANRDGSFANIARCKEMGFAIALDDAGSGFTSIFDLLNYPIDVVKLDRSLMRAALTQRGRRVMRGVVGMLHDVGMKVLAEGAETLEQAELARELGCDYIQGFYFYRPMPMEEVNRALKLERLCGCGAEYGRGQ